MTHNEINEADRNKQAYITIWRQRGVASELDHTGKLSQHQQKFVLGNHECKTIWNIKTEANNRNQ